jgi:hypothetical protein
MKKIERLRWIQSIFGPEFVLKYFFCKNWEEISQAIDYFENRGQTWGMRTDTNHGTTQGNLCPFLFKGSRQEAEKIWRENREQLYYLVSENLPRVFCHGVAELIDEEHIFIEFNDKEKNISQRDMYKHPENLRRIAVGPASYVFYKSLLIRSFHPEEVIDYAFDKIYFPMVQWKIKEITFSIKPNKQVIIW